MIIDTHTHFYDPSRPQGVPWPTPDNPLLYRTVLPEHCKALALPAGVTGTVVVEASSWLEDNQWILDLAAQDGFLVGLVGHIDPNRPEFAAELERFAANPLFRGIRCGGRAFADITQGLFLADMALLAAKNLALDVLLRHEQFDGWPVCGLRHDGDRLGADDGRHVYPVRNQPNRASCSQSNRRSCF